MQRSLFPAVLLAACIGTATAHADNLPVGLVEAETMHLPAGASLDSTFGAFGGGAVKMTANGALRTTVTLARRPDSVELRVRSLRCRRSWPNVSIQADGNTLMSSTKVRSSAWTTRSAGGFSLPIGTHAITIRTQMTRKRHAGSCNPALLVDRLVLTGHKKALTVTPTLPNSPYVNLVFGDEFGGAAGTKPDSTRWAIKVGKGWNNALNCYTARPSNVAMNGTGALELTARRETYSCPDGTTRSYTSGGILTNGKYQFTYGQVEARVWVPTGRGFWSAFWTLRYPIGAELDILEHKGQSPATLHTNARAKKTDGTQYWVAKDYNAPSSLATGYHVYGMTWQPNRISWQLDGVQVRTLAPSDLPSNYVWNFKEPEWIIFNLAVGGDWPLAPNSNTPFPSLMKVDWVRVFQ